MPKKSILTVLILYVSFLFSLERAYAGSIQLIRFWSESDNAYALVDYINDTENTYKGGVTIQCTAVDSEKKEIGKGQNSLFSEIRPGFQISMQIPVRLHGADLNSMECTLIEKIK